MNLTAEIRELPPELEQPAETGFYLSGTNTSDSLMMALTRRLGPEDGIVAGQTYTVAYNINFASAAESNCVGIGGAPGESVYLRAGATATEPMVVTPPEDAEGYVRLNVPAGNQSSGGPAASAAGNIANGVPCDGDATMEFVRVERTHVQPFAVTADENGELSLLVLTDSGFEGTTSLYYESIDAVLTPVPYGAAASLRNLSTRLRVGPERPATTGFVVRGVSERFILVRAIGPGLAQWGVDDALADPRLRLYNQDGEEIAFNDDWYEVGNRGEVETTSTVVGAFELDEQNADAAILALLEPGVYTAAVEGSTEADAGVVLLEVYDGDDVELDWANLSNLSTLARAGTGADAMFGGFVIGGFTPQRVLIRAVGPGLAAQGVENAEDDPELRLWNNGEIIAINDDWDADGNGDRLAELAVRTGAFALEPGSRDAALDVTLWPGVYSAEVLPGGDTAGTALIEFYRVPDADDGAADASDAATN